MPNSLLDALDYSILGILLQDARTPYLEISRICQVSGATVHLRIQKLEKLGVVKGSKIVLDHKKLGFGVSAFIGMYLDKCSTFEEILTHLTEIPAIVECHYTTGEYAIFLKVLCRDTDHLRELLIEQIQKIPNVRRTETFISLQMNFHREPDLHLIFDGKGLSQETDA